MTHDEYKNKLCDIVHEFGLEINLEQAEKFICFMDLLLEWNEKINLTAITKPEEILIKHFLDSISIIKFFKLENSQHIIDVGSGAGFPGIPLKILCPKTKFTLVDSLAKRVKFLKTAKDHLNLENIDCIHVRSEEFAKNNRESYDLCVSRAVAKLSVLTELCLPLVKIGGHFVAYKNFEIQEEISEAQNSIKKLGGEICDIKKILLPQNIVHSLIFVHKISCTPLKYPRPYAQIAKNPL